jgi:hypothetical protein
MDYKMRLTYRQTETYTVTLLSDEEEKSVILTLVEEPTQN